MFALLLCLEDLIGMERTTAGLSEQCAIVFAAFEAKEAVLQCGFIGFGLLAKGFGGSLGPRFVQFHKNELHLIDFLR